MGRELHQGRGATDPGGLKLRSCGNRLSRPNPASEDSNFPSVNACHLNKSSEMRQPIGVKLHVGQEIEQPLPISNFPRDSAKMSHQSPQNTADDSPVGKRARRKIYINIVIPLFITSIIAFLDRNNLSYAALMMNQDLHFTAKMFGFGAGIFFAGYVLFEIPGALIAEKFSPKWWLARIMISWGFLTGLMAFVSTPREYYALRFLIGAAEASLYPVIYACVIPRWFNVRDRARAIAFLLTSLQVSSIIGAPLAGWLIGVPFLRFKGWQGLFILEAVPAILFGFVLVRWMADWPRDAKWLTNDEKQFLAHQFETEMAARKGGGNYSVWQALRDREVLVLCGIYFLWMIGFWGFNYWMPTVLKAASGWSNLAVGWMIVIPMSLSLFTMLWIGDHSSKTGEKRWHAAAGLFMAAAGMLFGTITGDSRLAFLFMCMAGIGVYTPLGVWWSYPTTFLSGAAAAGAVGMINSFGSIGGFVGPYLTGYLKDLTGDYKSGWIYLALSMTFAGLLILTLKKR